MSAAAVELSGVAKRFRAGAGAIDALKGIDAVIAAGRITGLVGADGAGKTTLMRLIAGLLHPSTGTVRTLGLDIRTAAAAVQARIGYMPQRFGLYEDLSIAENLELYAGLHGLPPAARSQRFARLLAFTGLAPFARRLAGRLSGGMKQKLGLACVLVRTPELLLLDEPGVGVDPISRRELWAMVEELAGGGVTVLWSTAYLDEAQRCAEILVLDEGRLAGAGPPAGFLAEVDGRVAMVRPRPERDRAELRALRARPEVEQAALKGDSIRVLLRAGARPEAVGGVSATPVLEDAILARLAARRPPASRPPPVEAGAAAGGVVIEARDLVRDFGTFRAVDRVGFTVARGEIFGLLGPNGAGKSTTFKLLCGLLPPSAGEARVLGFDLRRARAEARAHIGYMAQRFAQYADLTVEENLRFTAGAYGIPPAERDARVAEALGGSELARFAGSRSGELPLGLKQRLAMACALLHRPEILFLDEPTSGVDPLVRREFWDRINALAAAGVTVMVTTHFIEEAEYCDRVAIIAEGRLVALGTPAELRARVRSPKAPDPTLEDAFVALVSAPDRARAA
jgi:ABC-2 type transport system ATP-binding protein